MTPSSPFRCYTCFFALPSWPCRSPTIPAPVPFLQTPGLQRACLPAWVGCACRQTGVPWRVMLHGFFISACLHGVCIYFVPNQTPSFNWHGRTGGGFFLQAFVPFLPPPPTTPTACCISYLPTPHPSPIPYLHTCLFSSHHLCVWFCESRG